MADRRCLEKLIADCHGDGETFHESADDTRIYACDIGDIYFAIARLGELVAALSSQQRDEK